MADMNLPERTSDNKLPAYAFPGGYPIIYLDSDNEILCADCATKSADDPDQIPSFKPVACDVYYEGEPETCSDCGKSIESAYGDPAEAEKDVQ